MVTGTSAGMSTNVNGTATMHVTLKDSPIVKSDRRSNKPIMEKRRRARINNCLNELKTLILDATKKDPARHSKLEKADILEKTVKHLQELQRQQSIFRQSTDPKVINKFKAGFAECANEVSRFPGLEPLLKRRLLQHLSGCINSVKTDLQQQRQHIHAHILPSPPSSPEQESPLQQASSHLEQIKYTGNAYFLPNGQQVIPTKMPNNNIAFIMSQQPPPPQQHHHPIRTASTSSASSQCSLMAYEQHSYATSPTHHNLVVYNPPSPANSYDTVDYMPIRSAHNTLALAQQQQQQQQLLLMQQHQQQPLSLVVKKCIKEEEQPWRPW